MALVLWSLPGSGDAGTTSDVPAGVRA
jgi:hypothetical protein